MADIYGTFIREQEIAKRIKEAVKTKKEWVALSDKVKLHFIKYAPTWTVIELIESIEAELKEKNT